jgi:hypothetical protein
MASLSRALVAIIVVASASFASTAPAQAQNVAIAAQVGTTGLGGGVVVGLTSKVNVRAMFGVIPTEPSADIDGIDFTLDDLPSFFLATLDLYPVGAFRLSAGLLRIGNDGNIGVTGTFVGVPTDFGGVEYVGSEDDLLIGSFLLKQTQPYLGIGIGNPIGKRVGINFDAGVGFGSVPTVTMTAEGPLAEDPVTGLVFLDQVQQEVADIEEDIPNILKYYPVLSLSVSIGF